MPTVKSLMLEGATIPEKLRNLHDTPKTLYLSGNGNLDELLKRPIIAIVGSRKVDAYGTHVTKMLASDLASRGAVIVSGLALGVDGIAHTACMDAGGATIAFMANGIGGIYPQTNLAIGRRMQQHGFVISEHDGDYMPYRHDFLIRNRLISGLADAVIVTQAAARSGSLNTASHALEQGKLVMAVPGPITNPLCEGPNNLLKMGASLATSADDVWNALNMPALKKSKNIDYSLLAQNEPELNIISLLVTGDSDGEVLAAKSGLSAQEFNVHLTMLEIRGIITPLGANHWTLL